VVIKGIYIDLKKKKKKKKEKEKKERGYLYFSQQINIPCLASTDTLPLKDIIEGARQVGRVPIILQTSLL
jgi:hypothetical protein